MERNTGIWYFGYATKQTRHKNEYILNSATELQFKCDRLLQTVLRQYSS